MSESKTTASQSGTHLAYHVEVRSIMGVKTMMVKNYGTEWVNFTPEQSCIPPSRLDPFDRHFGLMTYAEATAVAWMVKAYCNSMHEFNSHGIDVRVVESKVEYSYNAVRVREFDPLPYRPDPKDVEGD